MRTLILFKFNEMKRKRKLKSWRRTFNLLLEHHCFTRTQRTFEITYLLFLYYLRKERGCCTGLCIIIKHGLKKCVSTDSLISTLKYALFIFKKYLFLFISRFYFNKNTSIFCMIHLKIPDFVNFFCFFHFP